MARLKSCLVCDPSSRRSAGGTSSTIRFRAARLGLWRKNSVQKPSDFSPSSSPSSSWTMASVSSAVAAKQDESGIGQFQPWRRQPRQLVIPGSGEEQAESRVPNLEESFVQPDDLLLEHLRPRLVCEGRILHRGKSLATGGSVESRGRLKAWIFVDT